jgi:uncharacterized protein YnzC (UPF0291/DUF896 family)
MIISEEKLARLNELARKSKREPLSPLEKEEQCAIRAEYLAKFRENFRNLLESIEIVDGDSEKKT